MNYKRAYHGIGILTLDGEDQVVIFGAHDGNSFLDSVEVYDQETKKWTTLTDIKLTQAKAGFGFLTFKQDDLSGL